MPEADNHPTVSVVVATHNRAARLGRLLEGLRAQTLAPGAFEVVVVNDGSTDETASLLARDAKRDGVRLHVISTKRSEGPATARDVGWRTATAPLIAFTDDDCLPHPDWLEAGISAWAGDPDLFVQGRTEPDPDEVWRQGPFSRTIEVRDLHPAFNTCNIFYPRDLLERIDGFDTEAFDRAPGGEDSDLAWRAIAAGATVVFAEDALVLHAVEVLGPVGMLRVAARWTTPMQAYARHAGLRRSFVWGIFWKHEHMWLAGAMLALALPLRWHALRTWLMYPYLRNLWARGRVTGGGPLLAPFYIAHDIVETYAVARAGIRHRRLML